MHPLHGQSHLSTVTVKKETRTASLFSHLISLELAARREVPVSTSPPFIYQEKN
ncbi:hypothetical protein PGT21_032634 [Puccinia graminis f. sp. tritici]|uniref:Uncharacterized protein n=1 Tax=Puccinia graminis f. sp. tritici TaxID=56615 RepID=A0A5B0MPK1_PUCGR|nr:hypothetical protein PGT21_032634 [Puccinia graminis f. sp. tritici]